MSATRDLTLAPDAGLYGFVVERIRRGAMVPLAVHRANRIVRHLGPVKAATGSMLPEASPLPVRGALATRPIHLDAANAFVAVHHRHHGPVLGAKFALGVFSEAGLHGVAIVGRPLARRLDDDATLEILRVASDGAPNACSKLLGAVRRHARQLGHARRQAEAPRYRRLVTYTLPEEGGASLRAAGFVLEAATRGGSWSRVARPRVDKHVTAPKWRWSAPL